MEVKDETADVGEVGGGVEKRMSSRKEGETFTKQRLDMDMEVILCAGKEGRGVEMG